MRHARIVTLLAVLVSVIEVTPAWAGFINEASLTVSSQEEIPQLEQGVQSEVNRLLSTEHHVVQLGQRPAEVLLVQGKGRDIALSNMVSVVVPRDFELKMGKIEGQQMVSWVGGQPWDRVLMNALAPLRHIKLMIDWERKLVSLHQAAQSISNNLPTQKKEPQWAVRAKDVTLRQTLSRWAKEAGWQVAWEMRYDYPVQLEGVFSGKFEDAVKQLMQSLRYSEYPAFACLYEINRVVRVLHYGDKKQCEA